MAINHSPRVRLNKPGVADRNWNVPLNANVDILDALSAIGGLAVSTTETPSSTLRIAIASGSFVGSDGTVTDFPGAPTLSAPGSTTVRVWLTPAGAPVLGLNYPTTPHLRLAKVTTSASSVISIEDERVQCMITGSQSAAFVSKQGDTISGSLTVATPGTGTALLQLNATARTIGFFGASPQGPAPALPLLTDGTGGSVTGAIQDVGSTHSQSIINANLASLTARINALIDAMKRHGLMS